MNFWKRWVSRSDWERSLSEEVRDHLERQTEANVAAGMTPAEARRQAMAQLGGTEAVKEACREERRGIWIETFWSDVRYGLRMLRKNPGFSAIAILTLALGIGASTSVFSLVDAILLKPLPYPDPEHLVMVWEVPPAKANLTLGDVPWGRVESNFFCQEAKTFEAIAAFKSDSFNLTGSGEPVRLNGVRASAGFFPALGVSPVLGRSFTPEEDEQGHEHVVVLSHTLWRERFGADAGIVGRVLELNSSTYTVIGVMPAGFAFPHGEEMPAALNFPREVQIWLPLAINRGPRIPAEPWELTMLGRVRAGLTLDQSAAEMAVLAKRLEEQEPYIKGWAGSRLVPIAQQAAGDSRRPLLLILAAVGIVLLIACFNVAGLLLARSLERRREFTLRAALGARRRRIVGQLLTENLVLGFMAAGIGAAFAEAGIRFAKAFGPTNLPRLQEVNLDLPVLAFMLAITLVTTILFGLIPALTTQSENLVDSLKEGGPKSSGSARGHALRKSLLVSEVALALVLVIAAGLLTRTFFHLLGTNPGFNPSHVLTFELSLPATKYPDQPHIVALYQNALQRVRSIPGVQAAGIVETVPMGGATENTGIRIPGRPPASPNETLTANYTMISPGYLSAIGTPILRGRDFLETDTADSLPVTIISDSMAKKYWPGQDPIGQQVGPGSVKYPAHTIVGIAADVKHLSFREESFPEMYVPYTQKVWPSLLTMDVVLRTVADPGSMTSAARKAIHAADSDLPLAKIAPLSTLVDDAIAKPKFAMLLLGSFGIVALLLAAVGMYGVISYSVAQRTREIGIRMALGAQRRTVFGMVLGLGARLTGLGIAIGLVAAFALTGLMKSFLYGVQATDAATFALVSLFLTAVALLACYVPARRAVRVDPLVALRHE